MNQFDREIMDNKEDVEVTRAGLRLSNALLFLCDAFLAFAKISPDIAERKWWLVNIFQPVEDLSSAVAKELGVKNLSPELEKLTTIIKVGRVERTRIDQPLVQACDKELCLRMLGKVRDMSEIVHLHYRLASRE